MFSKGNKFMAPLAEKVVPAFGDHFVVNLPVRGSYSTSKAASLSIEALTATSARITTNRRQMRLKLQRCHYKR